MAPVRAGRDGGQILLRHLRLVGREQEFVAGPRDACARHDSGRALRRGGAVRYTALACSRCAQLGLCAPESYRRGFCRPGGVVAPSCDSHLELDGICAIRLLSAPSGRRRVARATTLLALSLQWLRRRSLRPARTVLRILWQHGLDVSQRDCQRDSVRDCPRATILRTRRPLPPCTAAHTHHLILRRERTRCNTRCAPSCKPHAVCVTRQRSLPLH